MIRRTRLWWHTRTGRPPAEESPMMTTLAIGLAGGIGVAIGMQLGEKLNLGAADRDLAEAWREGREAGYLEGRAAIAGFGYVPNPPQNPYERTDQ